MGTLKVNSYLDIIERIKSGVIGLVDCNGIFPSDEQKELIRLADIGQRMQWVDIKDGLPLKENYCLIYDTECGVHEATITFNIKNDNIVDIEWWMNDKETFTNVTHWCNLPPSPSK